MERTKENKWQRDSKVCDVKIEARANGSWDCMHWIAWMYSDGAEPDCSTCDVAKKYGYLDDEVKG